MPRGRTRRATTRRTKADKEKEEAESATTTPAGSANNSDDDDDDDEPENNSKTATTTAKAAPVTRRSRRARKPTSKVVGSAGGRKNAAPSANSNKRGAAKKKVEDEDGSNDEEDNDDGSEGEDDKKDQVEEDEEEETERSGKDDLEEDDTSKKKEADDDESEDEEDDSSKKGDAEDNDDDDDSADDDKPIASLAKGGRRAAAVPAKSKKGTKASKAAAAKPATGRRATRRSSRTLSEGDEESDHKAAAKNKKTPVTRRRKRGVSAKSSEDESLASGGKGKRARTIRKTRGKSKNESDNDSEDDNDDDEKGESSDNNEKGADDMSVEAGDDAAGAKGSGKDNDSAEDEVSDDGGEEDEKATSTGRRTRGRQPKKAKTTAAATDKQTGKSKQQRGNQAADKKKEREKEAGKPATRKKRTRGAAKKQQGSSSDEGESSPEEDGDSTNEKTDFKKKTTKKTGTRNDKDDDSHADESEGGDEDSKNSESESENSKTSANKTSGGRKTRNNNRSQKQSSSDADEAISTIDKEEPTEDDTGKDQQKAKVSSEEKLKDPVGTAEPEAKGQPNDPPEKDEVIAIDDEDDVDNSDKSSEVEKDNNKVGEQDATDEIKSADSADDTGKDEEEVTVVIGTDTRIKQDPPEEKGDSGNASEIQEPNKTVDVSVEENAKSDPVGVKEGKAGADVEDVKMEEAPKEEQIMPKELGSADMASKTEQEGTAEDPSSNSVLSKTERRISSTDAPTTLSDFGTGEIEEGGSGDVVEHSEDQPGSIDEVDNKMEIAQGENATEKTSVAPPKIQQSTEAQATDSARGEQGSSADVGKANEKQETEFRKDESTTLQSPAEVTKKSASIENQRAEAITDGSTSLKEKMSNETVGEGEVSTAPVNGASGNTNAEVSQESLSNGALSSDAPKDSPGGLTEKSTGPALDAEGGFAEQNTGESGVDDGDREKIIETEASEEPDALALASKQADSTPKSPLADTARSDAANEKAALESIISKSLPEDKPELLPVHAESAGDKAIVAAPSGNIVAGSQIEGVEEKAPENTATPSKGMSFAPSTPPTTPPPQPLVAMQIRDGATKDIPDQGVVLTDSHGPDKPTEEDEGSAMEVDETNHTQVKRPLEANIEEAGNAKALPPAKRSRVLSDAEWVSSSSELKAHGSDVPVEPEEPPEPIDEIHVKRCDLDKIKAMLFSAGSLEHRGRGFEKMFSEYWGAISLIVVGDQDAKIMAKLRKVVKSFLKTKRLRRLHNRLILALIDRSLQDTVPLSEVASVIPPTMRSKIAIISPYQKPPPEVKRELPPVPIRTPQNAVPDIAKKIPAIGPIPYAPLFAERYKQDTKPSTEVNKTFPSSCLPGALVVDPIVRRIVESEGMQVSESAVWLVVIALKEYTKSIVGRTIQSKEARQKMKLPSKPHFPRVLCKAKGKTGLTKKGSKGSKELPSKPLSSPSKMGIDPKVDSNSAGQMIFPADISLLSANMKRNPMDSLGGTVSRLAVERGIFAPANTSQALRSGAFDDVHRFLTSEIMAASAERQKLLRSQRLAAKRSVSPKPTSVDDQQDVKKEDFSAPRTSSPGLERGASRSLSVGAGRGGKNLGLGRGAKNLAALKARATVAPAKPAADTAIESVANKPGEAAPSAAAAPASAPKIPQPPVGEVEKKSDNPKPETIATNEQVAAPVPSGENETETASSPEKKGNPNQVVNRGRGLGKKNLLALRSRIVKPNEKDDAKEATSAGPTEGASPATASGDTQSDNQVAATVDSASTKLSSAPAESTAEIEKAAAETTTQTAQPEAASAAESGSQTKADPQTSITPEKPSPDNSAQAPTGTLVGQPGDTTVAATTAGAQTKADDAKKVGPVEESGTSTNKPVDDSVAVVKPDIKATSDISTDKAGATGNISEQPKQNKSENTATKADETKQAAEKMSVEGLKPTAHIAEGETSKDNEDKKAKEETSGETSKEANVEKPKTEGRDSKPKESEAKDTELGKGESKGADEKESKDNATADVSVDSSKAVEEK